MKEENKRFIMQEIKSGRYFCDKDGNIFSKARKSIVPSAQVRSKRGYKTCKISRDGRVLTALAHCVVYMFFHGEIPEGKEINHIDGDKSNNKPHNLELTTRSGNVSHAYTNGLLVRERGENHGKSKLTNEQVVDIKYLLYLGPKCGFTCPKIAQSYAVWSSTIGSISRGRTWSHIK